MMFFRGKLTSMAVSSAEPMSRGFFSYVAIVLLVMVSAGLIAHLVCGTC